MNSLVTVARNIRHFLFEKDGVEKFVPEIEAVLTTSEKSMEFVGSGIVNTEKMTTTRFLLSPESARAFAKNLNEWADEADKQSAKVALALEEAE